MFGISVCGANAWIWKCVDFKRCLHYCREYWGEFRVSASLLWLSFFKCWCVYRTVCAWRSDLVGFAPSQQVSMPAEVVQELWYNTFMMDGHHGYRNFDIMRQSINRKTHFAWVLHHPSWARCALIKVFLLSRGPPFREDAGTRPRLESNILASPLMWASEVQNVLEMETNSNSSCIGKITKKRQLQFFFHCGWILHGFKKQRSMRTYYRVHLLGLESNLQMYVLSMLRAACD